MLKKDEGSIEHTIALMVILIVSFLVLHQYRLTTINLVSELVEDSITASNLASAVIDIEEFGTTNEIKVKDAGEAYETYCNALKSNLMLDDYFMPVNNDYIKSNVTVHDYILYNVNGNDIEEYRFSNGVPQALTTHNSMVGVMLTPDGKLIENTTIYSKVGFTIRGLQEDEYYVYKDESVDITTR